MIEGDNIGYSIYAAFTDAADAINKFCFNDDGLFTDFKVTQQTLHKLSVLADDWLETKLKDKDTANKNHDLVLGYLEREAPMSDEDTIKEYRATANTIIRNYSKLIGEAFR